MPSLGHGISDAVRNHIPVWVDDALVNVLYDEYKKTGGILKKDGYQGFGYRIRQSDQWKRSRSGRVKTSTGFERRFECRTVQKVTLVVHSPESDMSANAYVFRVDGKAVAGGKTKLQSTHVTSAVSRKDKTTVRAQDVTFVKFSEEELRKMRTEMEFGDGFAQLELERGD